MRHDPIIYYVGARDVRRVKIGTTTDLRRRMERLGAQAIDRLEILATEPGGRAEERQRHVLFARFRRHGEWFEWSPEIQAWVDIVLLANEREESTAPHERFVSHLAEFSLGHAWAQPAMHAELQRLFALDYGVAH